MEYDGRLYYCFSQGNPGAKEFRIMREADWLYPQYGFAGHKGYGTAAHIEALRQYGPCPIHRRSFITHFVN